MSRETLIAELNRLLDAGEPLLDVFPKQQPDGWMPQTPDNISLEMRWYAASVSFRDLDRKRYQHSRQQDPPAYLAGLVVDFKSGLLGWRAIGVLK